MQRRLEAATGSRFSFVLSEGRKADLDSAQGGDDGLDIPASGLSTIVLPSSIIQSSSPPHHIPLPRTAATIFATIPLPCAVNGILRPRNVLELFEVEWLASALDQTPRRQPDGALRRERLDRGLDCLCRRVVRD